MSQFYVNEQSGALGGLKTINTILPDGSGNFTLESTDGSLTITPIANGLNLTVTHPGFHWTVTSSVAFTPAANTGYILIGASMATITLPTGAPADFWFAVADSSGHLFTIAQNAGDRIQQGNDFTTLGAGGSIVSNQPGAIDSFVCYAAGPGASWIALWPQGQFTVN
jgi:hypothetical protein